MPPVDEVLQRLLTLGGNASTILITPPLQPFAVQNGDQMPVNV
jgi:hypothetical protein